MSAYARVLVDTPLPQLDRLFDYRIPPELVDAARPGARVKVPFRSAGRTADGWIVELADEVGFAGEVNPIDQVVSPVPVLSQEVWRLARRVADRSAGSASDVLRLAIPSRQARVENAWSKARSAADGAGAGPAAEIEAVELAGYPARLAELIAASGKAAVDAVPHPLAVRAPGGPSVSASGSAVASGTAPASDTSRPAVAADGPGDGPAHEIWVGGWAVLLAGAATHALAAGGSAVLAVPDHRDQEQLVAALQAVLPADRIVQLDARQTPAERYRAFLRCLEGAPLAIVGNRSVVYAPAERLGLLAMFGDGDPLFAEPLAPYAHARDVALLRHEEQGGALLFVGHTRSTDVERLHQLGWLEEVVPAPRTSPRLILAGRDVAGDRLAAQARIPSLAWREASAALEHGPVLVQVARPGFATQLVCEQCGEQARCLHCGGPLRTQTAGAPPNCAWCGALAGDWRCASCSGTRMRRLGAGSVRTAVELGKAFPGTRVIVADGDHRHLRVGAEPALIVATRGAEPMADGGYRAVLLLDGERMLARESLRVAEDCLRWWSDAAALASRGAPVVLAGVEGQVATALATWRQADFARAELADRRRLAFPPSVRVATVTGRPEEVAGAVDRLRDELRDVLGPVETEDGARAILRFDYARGQSVAADLRGELVRRATGRRPAKAQPGGRRAPVTKLRVRLDDPDPFV